MDGQHRLFNWVVIVAAVAFAVTLAMSWLVARQNGRDFGLLYVTAVGISEGAPVYDNTWAQAAFASRQHPSWKNVPYPPSSGIVTLPLAAFSLPLARTLWFFVMAGAVIAGVRSLILLALPKSRPSVWLFASSVVFGSACMRWGFSALQSAPLVFALLAALLFALHTNRPRLAFFAVSYAAALKFTIAFPFLALLVLHKRYRMLLGSVASVGILNVIGFARVGGWAAVSEYRAGIQGHEAFGSVDSPDPWDPVSFSRVDWPYLLNGIFGYHESFKFVALAAVGLTTLWLFMRSLRLKGPVSLEASAAFLAPLICVGLFSVYHHSYDCSALYVPLIVLLSKRIETGDFNNNLAWCLMGPLLFILALLPWVKVLLLADAGDIPGGRGVINIIFPIATTLLFCGTLLFVRDMIGQNSRRSFLPASARQLQET